MLLAYLMRNAGKVVSRTQILNQVWGYGFDPGTKVVDVYIRYLRQKVDAGADVPLIRTTRGFGYMIAGGVRPGHRRLARLGRRARQANLESVMPSARSPARSSRRASRRSTWRSKARGRCRRARRLLCFPDRSGRTRRAGPRAECPDRGCGRRWRVGSARCSSTSTVSLRVCVFHSVVDGIRSVWWRRWLIALDVRAPRPVFAW